MFTALWIVNTIPVKIAAMSATPSDCTPIDSTSRRTSRKYLGGSPRLRITRPVRRPSPPYQTTVRLRESSTPSLRREALDQLSERLPPALEGRRRRDQGEVVHAPPVLQHVRLDSRERTTRGEAAVEHSMGGAPPVDRDVPPLDDGTALKPYQEVSRQRLQPRRRCLAPACCVGQHRRRRRVVPELEVRPARVDHRPL